MSFLQGILQPGNIDPALRQPLLSGPSQEALRLAAISDRLFSSQVAAPSERGYGAVASSEQNAAVSAVAVSATSPDVPERQALAKIFAQDPVALQSINNPSITQARLAAVLAAHVYKAPQSLRDALQAEMKGDVLLKRGSAVVKALQAVGVDLNAVLPVAILVAHKCFELDELQKAHALIRDVVTRGADPYANEFAALKQFKGKGLYVELKNDYPFAHMPDKSARMRVVRKIEQLLGADRAPKAAPAALPPLPAALPETQRTFSPTDVRKAFESDIEGGLFEYGIRRSVAVIQALKHSEISPHLALKEAVVVLVSSKPSLAQLSRGCALIKHIIAAGANPSEAQNVFKANYPVCGEDDDVKKWIACMDEIEALLTPRMQPQAQPLPNASPDTLSQNAQF